MRKLTTGQGQVTMRCALLMLVVFLQASAQDRFLVRIRGDAGEFARSHGLTLLPRPENPGNATPATLAPVSSSISGLYVATTGAESSAAQLSLRNDPRVQRMEVSQKVGLPKAGAASAVRANAADDKSASLQWYFGTSAWTTYVGQPAAKIIRIPEAQKYATGAGTVAILDTGVDFSNSVLSASLLFGWDFTTNSPGGFEIDPIDVNQSTTSILDSDSIMVLNQSTTSILDQSTTSILDGTPVSGAYGHGTMTAGIVHLVAPTARILPVKVFGNDGTSDLATILAGLYWAVDNGAKVINMSFSMADPSDEFNNALDYANFNRVICVASAGNNGQQIMVYPAGYKQVMGVASTDNTDGASSFTNYGNNLVTVAAPGEGIISTYPGEQYAAGWGTSFSAPFVSGAAALLVDISSNLNVFQAQKAVQQAAPAGKGLGAGRLDLLQTVAYQAARGDK